MEILFEDNHLLIVNKTPSEIVQGDRTGDEPITDKAKKYLKAKYNKPGNVFLGLVHRLDRPTSGVLVLGRTGKATKRLSRLFQEKDIKKTYWAITKSKPGTLKGSLQHYLQRNRKKNKSFAYDKKIKNSQKALLDYEIIQQKNNYFLWEINLQTGRHHQIRSQLSHINCPVVGDLKYGFPTANKDLSIHLHARQISFIHPVRKKPITINAPLPNDAVWNLFQH